MNELDTYIPPNIRLITRSLSDELPTWAMGRAEPGPNAKINCLFSLRHIFGHFLVFQSSFKLHFSLPTFLPRHLRFACWVSVCNWHSLNTNYYRTTFSGVPGSCIGLLSKLWTKALTRCWIVTNQHAPDDIHDKVAACCESYQDTALSIYLQTNCCLSTKVPL